MTPPSIPAPGPGEAPTRCDHCLLDTRVLSRIPTDDPERGGYWCVDAGPCSRRYERNKQRALATRPAPVVEDEPEIAGRSLAEWHSRVAACASRATVKRSSEHWPGCNCGLAEALTPRPASVASATSEEVGRG